MLARAHRSSFSWQRSAVFAAVIALHIVGFQLVSAFGGLGRIIEEAATTFTVLALPTAREEPPPEPGPVTMRQARPFEPTAPDPIVEAAAGESAGATITARIDDGGGNGNAGAAIAPPAVIPATPLAYRSRRSTDEYYPPVSIRLGEEGAAIVRVCVDAAGALQGVPQVTESSHHTRLDAAAVAWAREALTFVPATENGEPVAACKGFRVRFTLRQ